jgi:hypothetical protein
MFFAPGEVDRRIRSLCSDGLAFGGSIHVIDVLRWAMDETCKDIRHHLPFWAQQGLDHHKRFAAYKSHGTTRSLEVLRGAWLQRESRTLEEMYSDAKTDVSGSQEKKKQKQKKKKKYSAPAAAPCASVNPEINSVPYLNQRIEQLGITKLVDVRIAEEQEREVDHEVELERQVERPPRVQPAKHILCREIRTFVETGDPSQAFARIPPLLNPLDMADALASTAEWSPSPLATNDFITTVLGSNGTGLTEYLRPVNWILTSGFGKDSMVVVISPYEANALLPIIREKKKVRLSIYTPRVTSSMRSFSDLTFYSIPDSPAETWTTPAHARIALNLFSGQLFFDSKEQYEDVCILLALSRAHPGAEYNEIDGFVPPAYRTGRPSPFAESKIYVLKTLIGLRRKGMGFSRTHVGRILNAVPLSEETLSTMSS